jgi:hypothetical protein
LSYQGSIALNILAAEVIKKSPPLANHHQQTATAVVIAFVKAQVLGQMIDPLGQQRYLHLRRPGIAIAVAELGNDLLCGLHDARNLKSMGTMSV